MSFHLNQFSLENALRNFATLTKGDVISINYNEKVTSISFILIKSKSKTKLILIEYI
jgi:hypothetical protein